MKFILLASITIVSLGLVGCDKKEALGYNGQPICQDTALPFDYQMDTFEVSENLDRTLGWDYLNAIEPTDLSALNADQIAAFEYIKQKASTQFVAQRTPSPDDAITSFNNSLDTMESVIASEEVGNLNSARAQMLSAMNLNVTCSYYNTAAYLTDIADNTKHYIVRYNHIVEAGENPERIDKVLIEYEITDEVNDEGELKQKGKVTATSLSALSPASFTDVGYNQPIASVIQFIADDETLTLNKGYQKRVDTLEVVSNTPAPLGSLTDIKRVKLAINYESSDVSIFASTFIKAYQCENGDILYDPTISIPNVIVDEDNLELTIPSTETNGDVLDDTCVNPKRYYDENYDYNPVTDTPPVPNDVFLPDYKGTNVSDR